MDRCVAPRLVGAVAALCVAVMTPCGAQMQGPVRNVVVLDPAHGGSDVGAKLAEQGVEKDVTLALAAKLRPALSAAGFTVVATRDGELGTPLTADQRAEVANRQRAVACLVLHATTAGAGVHVYASPLQPPVAVLSDPDERPGFQPTLWDQAQADSVRQSLKLAEYVTNGLRGAGLPVLRGRASVPPLDNLTCPALAVEIAPLGAAGEAKTGVSDGGYQQRIADALVEALRRWRDDPMAHPAPAAAKAGGAAGVKP